MILRQVQCPNQLFAEIFTDYGISLVAVFSLAKACALANENDPNTARETARAVSRQSPLLCVSTFVYLPPRVRSDHNTKTQCRKEKHLLLSLRPRRPKREHGGKSSKLNTPVTNRWIKASKKSEYRCFCTACISHGGLFDINKHFDRKKSH